MILANFPVQAKAGGLLGVLLLQPFACSYGSSSKARWIPVHLGGLPLCLTAAKLTDKSSRIRFFDSASILLKQTLLLGSICAVRFTLGLSPSWVRAVAIRFFPFCNQNVPHHNRVQQLHTTGHRSGAWAWLNRSSSTPLCCKLPVFLQGGRMGNVVWDPRALTPKRLFLATLCTHTRGFWRDWSSPAWLRAVFLFPVCTRFTLPEPRSRGITWSCWLRIAATGVIHGWRLWFCVQSNVVRNTVAVLTFSCK